MRLYDGLGPGDDGGERKRIAMNVPYVILPSLIHGHGISRYSIVGSII